jgi:hypothetical protein
MFNQRELVTYLNRNNSSERFSARVFEGHVTQYTNTGVKQTKEARAEADNGFWFFDFVYKNDGKLSNYHVNVSLNEDVIGTGVSPDLEEAINYACQDARDELLLRLTDLPDIL